MPKLNKTETYAIKWLAHTGLDVSEISKELKVSEQQILRILEKEQPLNNNNKIKDGSSPAKSNKSNLMINQTAVKKTKSVSVMTEAASQQNDAVNKNLKPYNKNEKNIFRPNNA